MTVNIMISILVVAVVLGFGIYFIPTTSSVTKSVLFDAGIEEVWAVYADPQSQPNWRSEIEKVVMSDDGQSWAEHYKQGGIVINLTVKQREKPNRLVLETGTPNVFEGEYIAVFESLETGKTRGTFTETSYSLGIFPKIMRFVFVNPEKLIDKYAADATQEIQKRRR